MIRSWACRVWIELQVNPMEEPCLLTILHTIPGLRPTQNVKMYATCRVFSLRMEEPSPFGYLVVDEIAAVEGQLLCQGSRWFPNAARPPQKITLKSMDSSDMARVYCPLRKSEPLVLLRDNVRRKLNTKLITQSTTASECMWSLIRFYPKTYKKSYWSRAPKNLWTPCFAPQLCR